MIEFVFDVIVKGVSILIGGMVIFGFGNFFLLIVLMYIFDIVKIMIEELFGFVVFIFIFSEMDEVFLWVNVLFFGFVFYVFIKLFCIFYYVILKLEVGMVNVNYFGIVLLEMFLGGVKDSGMGSEGGSEIFDVYFVIKFIFEVIE